MNRFWILDFEFWINQMTEVERSKISIKLKRHANPKSKI